MLLFDDAMPVNGQEGHVQANPSRASQATAGAGTKGHHIWLVTGPAGCGKSTVAEHLAKWLDMPYIEGDSVRPVQAPVMCALRLT